MTKKLIIVLGYTLAQDGSVQSILKTRLDRAIAEYKAGEDTLLVCGKSAPEAIVPSRCEHTTEAEAMRQYLIGCGISSDSILKEERSATTFGNAWFSYLDVISRSSVAYQPIVVVSNEFHGPLVKYCFDKVLGTHYSYDFSAVPDKELEASLEEIELWKNVVKHLVEDCYPLLFADVASGDIAAIESVIDDSTRQAAFASQLKRLLQLDLSSDIVVASEEELDGVSKIKPK